MQRFHYDTIDSTNEQAKRLLAEGAITATSACITAAEQTAGRGTRGRSWSSPREAGLYLTLIEQRREGAPLRTTTLYTLAAGVACAEALREMTKLPIRIKPVNDLYCGEGKLGGILCESIIGQGRMTALIIGIGINLRRAARDPGDDRPVTVTDLEHCLGSLDAVPTPAALVDALVPAVRQRIEQADRDALAELRREWERLSGQPFPSSGDSVRH